ncbi:Pyrrolo-quinoline quinone [Pirellula staleyi DSM 6068]|uniref:Pyrrolo-quinoline quinone n=1 Tax=Pirellula staleyi (strain ATCC 27377 / DSM 6068 / ICPB 4128) TaxID=530564 RepID=D2R6V3_PIRSD|nr:PQQ-binding-like beta-propeller repeat protein [Pirellula staleyi]ADB17403.1 Pyrrolo-quinoline quinone [Pirellula staleyi DSM 6068]
MLSRRTFVAQTIVTGSLGLAGQFLAPGPVRGADWLGFRGPGGLGVAVGKEPPLEWSATSNVRWTASPPGAGNSSPIVVGSQIILAGYDGFNVPGSSSSSPEALTRYLAALDRKTGKPLWKTNFPARLPEQESIRDEHGYATNTPACDGKLIVAFFGKSGVAAFDLQGKQLWTADVGSGLNGWGSAASPLIHKDLVYINASVESEQLIALDKKTGKEVWRARGMKESWNTPVIVENPQGKEELVLAIFGKLLAFDPSTGTPLWNCDTNISWYMVPGLVSHQGIIYCIGGRTGGSLAVKSGGSGDVTDTHRVWVGKKGSNVSSPIYYEGHLYFAHEQLGIVYCADAKTGEIQYEERLPRAAQFYASPILAARRVYYLGRNGRCFVVAAKPSFELLATNDLEAGREVFNASPIALDGELLIRSDRRLYCIGA